MRFKNYYYETTTTADIPNPAETAQGMSWGDVIRQAQAQAHGPRCDTLSVCDRRFTRVPGRSVLLKRYRMADV